MFGSPNAVCLILLVTACSGSCMPTEHPRQIGVSEEASYVATGGLPPHDAELAQRIPGYGGIYFDEDRQLVVLLTDRTQEYHARHVITQQHRGLLRRATPHQDAPIVFRTAEYDLSELSYWRSVVLPEILGAVPGINMIGVAVRINRIEVGLEDLHSQHIVRSIVERSEVPLEAIRFVHIPAAGVTWQE